MTRTRILLIEDNRILREGITAIINAEEDMRVVASTAGSSNALQMARQFTPDVLLIDLGLRNQSVASVVKSMTRELPKVKVMGMGLVPGQSDIVEFVEAGASGFVMKDAAKGDFLGTIRMVVKGGKVIPPSLAGSLFSLVVDHAYKSESRPTSAVRLTKRERDVVTLIADGLSNKGIAHELKISVDTVKSHVHNILEKLALRSRLQIAKYRFDGEKLQPG